jgi:uncharacterized membrane protein
MQELGYSIFLFDFIILVFLTILIMYYTIHQTGATAGKKAIERYAIFGVMSFIFIGFAILGYIIFLFTANYNFIWTFRTFEFDLAHGFLTAIVGTGLGIFLVLLAVLRHREFGR